MYYYVHNFYGYLAASNPPIKNEEDYTPITKEEFDAYIESQQKKKEEEEDKEE